METTDGSDKLMKTAGVTFKPCYPLELPLFTLAVVPSHKVFNLRRMHFSQLPVGLVADLRFADHQLKILFHVR
jgi:hypothetical protein